MTKTIEKVSVTATGMTDAERDELEQALTAIARARIEDGEREDAETLIGIAEFEAGNFRSAEEFREEMRAYKTELVRKYGP